MRVWNGDKRAAETFVCYNGSMKSWFRRSRNVDPDPLPPDLRRELEQAPDSPVRVIVRVADRLETRQEAVEQLGLRVLRVLRLTSAMAVEGPGSAVLRLAAEPWVRSIERDRPVHTMSEEEKR